MPHEKKLTPQEIEPEPEPHTPPEPKFLSDTEAVFFYNAIHEVKPDVEVPQCTPDNISSLTILPQPFPASFPSFTDFNIPYVREIGVKSCMEIFGDFLDCKNYAYDYMQFWFIDILVDCLWKTQDEYYLREKEQKTVLDWIVYAFTMLTDKKLCFSRKQFFKFFKEIVFLAADFLNEGNLEIPHPNDLFVMVPQDVMPPEDSSEEPDEDYVDLSDTDSASTISFSTCKSNEVIEMEIGDQKRTYVIQRKKCFCMEEISTDNYDFPTSLSSSLTTTKRTTTDGAASSAEKEAYTTTSQESETDALEVQHSEEEFPTYTTTSQESETDALEVQHSEEEFPNKFYKVFYQPDQNVPKRFLPLPAASQESVRSASEDGLRYEVCTDSGGEYEGLEMDVDANFMSVNTMSDKPKEELLKIDEDMQYKQDESIVRISKPSARSIPSDIRSLRKSVGSKKSVSREFSKTIIKQSVPNLTDAEIMKRLQLMKLWEKRIADMNDSNIDAEEVSVKSDPINIDNENWEDVVDAKNINRQDERLYIGFGVLCAIVDFVFDYFYRNFHYILIKIAANNIPSVITQQLNLKWMVPKIAKGDFRRPKIQKPKKEKVKKVKEPSHKKTKSSKSDKKSKGKGSDKKSSKGSKESKKSKKEKPHKLTKEEKAELERLKKLEHEAEEERRKLEENKRFVFPLVDAATDELFMEIFENWKEGPRSGNKEKKGKEKGEGKGEEKIKYN
ncbi:hypothetical protein QE152_g23542 [Popillia japonica]|uniref:Uncharacterized protein n=1 Tax=Popillia japonica TaxID=7064 RepID=A0AAW1KHA4_POPJA